MKMIGLIGGISWESTAIYYRRLNEEIRSGLGGLNSAKFCCILSISKSSSIFKQPADGIRRQLYFAKLQAALSAQALIVS